MVSQLMRGLLMMQSRIGEVTSLVPDLSFGGTAWHPRPAYAACANENSLL